MRKISVLLLLLLAACGGSGGLMAPSEAQIKQSRTDAEAELRSAIGEIRVAFAKFGAAPERVSGGVDNKGTDYDQAKWNGLKFKLIDKVWSGAQHSPAPVGAIACEPLDEKFGWGACYFKFNGGEGEVKWYDSRKALDDALAAYVK